MSAPQVSSICSTLFYQELPTDSFAKDPLDSKDPLENALNDVLLELKQRGCEASGFLAFYQSEQPKKLVKRFDIPLGESAQDESAAMSPEASEDLRASLTRHEPDTDEKKAVVDAMAERRWERLCRHGAVCW